jgi:putative ribosome biogenesis GTPase RsgA
LDEAALSGPFKVKDSDAGADIGLALAESQVAAIRLALMSKVLVMTGGPGVGKTTIANAILRISQRKEWKFCYARPPAARPSA